jgi:hypothetical protein
MNVLPVTMELIQAAASVLIIVFATMVTLAGLAKLIERSLWG